jgi:hypothetical protein
VLDRLRIETVRPDGADDAVDFETDTGVDHDTALRTGKKVYMAVAPVGHAESRPSAADKI